MTTATPAQETATANTLADRLPLMPERDRASLTRVIDLACPIPTGNGIPPEEAWRRTGPINRAMIWLGFAPDPRRLPQEQECARVNRADLVVYAQHRWESQLGDITGAAQSALGVGQDNADGIAQQIMGVIEQNYILDKPGWAAEPKRATGMILARMAGSMSYPPGSDSAAGFWSGKEQPVAVPDVSEASLALAGDPGTDWQAITRAPQAGRDAVDTWFARLAAIDGAPATPAVKHVNEALDHYEQLLLESDSGQVDGSTANTRSSIRFALKWITVLTLICILAFIVPVFATIQMWGRSLDGLPWANWIVQGILAVVGWLAALALAGTYFGHYFLGPTVSSGPRRRWPQILTTVVIFALTVFSAVIGPSLPAIKYFFNTELFMLIPWPKNLLIDILTELCAISIIYLGAILGKNAFTQLRVQQPTRQPDPDLTPSAPGDLSSQLRRPDLSDSYESWREERLLLAAHELRVSAATNEPPG